MYADIMTRVCETCGGLGWDDYLDCFCTECGGTGIESMERKDKNASDDMEK